MANARFQAAAALQESAIREWGLLTADEKSSLRMYVFILVFFMLKYEVYFSSVKFLSWS